MGCCETKDDPYNYHFEPPIKSNRESRISLSKEMKPSLVKSNIVNPPMHSSFISDKDESFNMLKEINNDKSNLTKNNSKNIIKKFMRKKSCEIILPKISIDNFSTFQKKNKSKFMKAASTAENINFNKYKYIFEDPIPSNRKLRSKRSNSKSISRYKNNLSSFHEKPPV